MPGLTGIVAITDDLAAHAGWLASAEALHVQLRPDIPGLYGDYMRRMFDEGAEMALLVEDGSVRAVAVYHCLHTTFQGYRFYLDDLVADAAHRARGHGRALMAWCEARARERGCDTFALDSGTPRARAHKFYFNLGFGIAAFSFGKSLRPG